MIIPNIKESRLVLDSPSRFNKMKPLYIKNTALKRIIKGITNNSRNIIKPCATT